MEEEFIQTFPQTTPVDLSASHFKKKKVTSIKEENNGSLADQPEAGGQLDGLPCDDKILERVIK
jgi:hypothetical protein